MVGRETLQKGIELLICLYVLKVVREVRALIAGDEDCKYLYCMDNGTRQRIAGLVNMLRLQDCISDLEKDILDTWNELNKNPFDMDSAKIQELHNRGAYPDVYAAVLLLPTTIVKDNDQVTQSDLVYLLGCQLELMLSKRFGQVYGLE